VPLIEFLDRQGVAIDEIVGCSGGGVVASLYGAGLDGRGIRSTIAALLQRRLFTDFDPTAPLSLLTRFGRGRPGVAMIRPNRIQAMYRQVFGEHRMEGLPRRLLLQATHFQRRSGVVLRRGLLADALYASTAAYPLLPPIRMDGEWLCDGAFSAPLPLAAGQGLADVTLAVSVNASPTGHLGHRLLGFPAELQLDPEAVGPKPRLMLLRMPIDGRISWWDTHRIPELFAAGERAVAQHASAICAALDAASNANLLDVVAGEQGHH
jgi:NTE family protein